MSQTLPSPKEKPPQPGLRCSPRKDAAAKLCELTVSATLNLICESMCEPEYGTNPGINSCPTPPMETAAAKKPDNHYLLEQSVPRRMRAPRCRRITGTRWRKWLELEFTDRKVRGSNPTSACRLLLSRLGQTGSIPALVLPSGGMAARHRKGVTAERLFTILLYGCRPAEPNKFA
ncbi:hypothetical protein CSKR_102420 [Clonorchis sinensis]|uniref:Uncharacterized protein n=1 Tax=Clonorchis sinensis TaxID=79923 RepID=A0A419QF62_CLOSI|nr:hypothetical protein CSKR_102420 [Clonorchis sinensis]